MLDLGYAKRPKKIIEPNKKYIKRSVDDIVLNVDYNNIYELFDEKKPLENKDITETYFKWVNWNIYNNYIEFCKFLLNKILNSTNRSEIKKIPQIISNISSYRWSAKNFKNKIVIEKRNEVMFAFKNKNF